MIWGWRIFFKEAAQNGARCEGPYCGHGGARRALCALKDRVPCGKPNYGRGSVTAAMAISCIAAWAAFPLAAGSVTGHVELKDSNIASVRKGRDYSGVVVWLLPADGAPTPSDTVKSGGKHARLIQKDKTFTPHVLAIETGTTVDFPNYDPIFHNAFSNFSGQLFDIGLYAPGTSKSFRFQRSGVVRIFCNIHPAMSAVILVVDTPYFTVSSRGGEFEIAGVTPGEYKLRVFHERASENVLQGLERTVTVGAESLTLSKIEISESGYLPASHKNKYGKDYSNSTEDGLMYPSTAK
jgi:plastocyanin